MRRTSFNDGWTFRPKSNRFSERIGAPGESRQVTLPHDAVIGTERSPSAPAATGFFGGGVWVYQRVFEHSTADEAVVLEFEGVYRDAIVYVNGEFATHRPFGYSGFAVQIDHLLHLGDGNEVRVEARAHDDTRWYTGGGIYRDVWLLTSGRVHFAPNSLAVRTPEVDEGGAIVGIDVVVRNQSTRTSTLTMLIAVFDAANELVAQSEAPVTTFPGDELTVHQRLFVEDPTLWRLDDPHLYTCRVMLLDGDVTKDDDATTFGVRTLSLDPRRGLRINGEAVLLRGACIHHDNGPIGAATIGRAEERRVEVLKAAGFNAIRSAHNPASRALLDACDCFGMVVLDETFDVWRKTKAEHDYALRTDEWWEADLEAMVRKDINHPSVIFYSIGNEIPDGSTMAGLHLARSMAAKVRHLDPTRFVTQAVSGLLVSEPEIYLEIGTLMEERVNEGAGINTAMTQIHEVMPIVMKSPTVTARTTEAFSHLDAAGYNYMETRFELDGEAFPNRVVLAAETHPGSMDVCWTGVVNNPHVVGDFTWTGYDYLGEPGVGRTVYADDASDSGGFLGDFPWLTAWCADIDITGRRRPQSYYREIVWGLRRDPYIAVVRAPRSGLESRRGGPWSWSDTISSWSWPGHEGRPIAVEVYVAAEEVELVLNGRSLGGRPAGEKHRYRAEFEVVFEPGTLEAIAWQDGAEVGRMTLQSARGPVRLVTEVDRTEVRADASDLAFVEVAFVDSDGVIENTADRVVSIEVEGPGVLQGFASADPRSTESFVDSEHTTFDGRALAVIRPTGAGTITVTASAADCDPQRVSITAN